MRGAAGSRGPFWSADQCVGQVQRGEAGDEVLRGVGAALALPHADTDMVHLHLDDACVTQADGHAERIAALHMIEPRADRPRAVTLGLFQRIENETCLRGP